MQINVFMRSMQQVADRWAYHSLKPSVYDTPEKRMQKQYTKTTWNNLVILARTVDLTTELKDTGRLQDGKGQSNVTSDLLIMEPSAKALWQKQEETAQKSLKMLQDVNKNIPLLDVHG